jgi:hypothetical protein
VDGGEVVVSWPPPSWPSSGPPIAVVIDPKREAAERFHAQHPEVFACLLDLARQAQAAGRRRIGVRLMLEVARWHLLLRGPIVDYKINNNHQSFYADLLRAADPTIATMIERRPGRSSR